MGSITLLSPAKVNLLFEILFKRKDGYHDIRTLIQPVNIFDAVTISTKKGSNINLRTEGIKPGEPGDNIAFKAASLYREKSGIDMSVDIYINKKIPLGAGLGGGSSNAAAVLVGLNRLAGKLSHKELIELSPKLGADVAVFINCVTSLAEGIGEIITPIRDFPLFYYVIIYPRLEVSTKSVYEQWDMINKDGVKSSSINENTYSLFKEFNNDMQRLPLFNDLEMATFQLYPKIEYYRDFLLSCGAKSVLMSGSGSAVYAAFKNEEYALEIFDYLKSSEEFDTYLARGIHGWYRLV